MIAACSIQNKIIITVNDARYSGVRLERRSNKDDTYLVYTGLGFCEPDAFNTPVPVSGDLLDTFNLEKDTLYSYRYADFQTVTPADKDYAYSNWVRIGGQSAIGYTFGNYHVPDGLWGEAVTCDDLRFTYLWGTDFKAANGQSYTDEQIRYFIDASVAEIERRLDITIKKKKIRCNAKERNLIKGVDYDTEEALYDFRFAKIARYGLIKTRQKPIIVLHKLELFSRFASCRDLTAATVVDKTKGVLKLMERPMRPSETANGIGTAIGMYGNQTMNGQLFYAIDYDAGFETSDDIPEDLRQIIAKHAAVSLLNIIGDGLMSGFSSSSLSMDGLSESFSSTQSATSAYFGARIKVYQDEIEDYIQQNKNKFGHMIIGTL